MTYSDTLDIRVTDTTLRDGSHAKRHQFTEEHVRSIVAALDDAGMPVIEVTHGDGLGGSSYNYGFSMTDERILMKVAVDDAVKAEDRRPDAARPRHHDDIKACADLGVSIVRIATHCTEADIAIQHFGVAHELGLETVGFLMMAHSQPPEVLAAQARIMVDAGCQCAYVVDSAGALILEDVPDRVGTLLAEVGDDTRWSASTRHENLGLSVANSVAGGPGGCLPDRRVHAGLRRRRGQHPAGDLRRRGRPPRHPDRS